MARNGRPSLLDRYNLTTDDLYEMYQSLGTQADVARYFGVTVRTINKYLSGYDIPQGRPPGTYRSTARQWLENNIDLLREKDRDIIRKALTETDVSPTYMRKVLQAKRRRVNTLIERRVRRVIHENVAVQDVRGRYIPTAAIRYVWVPKWRWDRPVHVRVVLRDKTRAKLLPLYTPVPTDALEDVSGHSDSGGQ